MRFDVRDWQGVVGPAGLPPATLSRINADIQQVLDMPDVQSRIAAIGGEVTGGPPARFAQHLRDEAVKWGRVVREAGITVD